MEKPIDRRGFLATTAAAIVAARPSTAAAKTGFSLALGGGAARGLAHIPVLEALDDLGVKPIRIAGTSMGSIIGAAYASGIAGLQIREYAIELLATRLTTIRRLFPGSPANWASIFSLGNSAMLEAEVLMETVLPAQMPADFSALEIPLLVVTTDFYREDEFVIASGALHKAIGASCALPVLLAPVAWQERVLIDGGFVNPTPFDILAESGVAVVAVDVTGNGSSGDRIPGALDTWIGAAQISLHSLVNERLKRITPDLLIRPDVGRFSTMDFHKITEILEAAAPAREQTKRQLDQLLSNGG